MAIAAILLFFALAARLFEVIPGVRLLRPTILVLLFTAFVLATDKTAVRLRAVARENVAKWFMAFLVGCLLSVPASIWLGNSVAKLSNLMLLAVLFLMIALVPAIKQQQELVERWCVAAIAAYAALFLLFAREGYGGGRFAVPNSAYDPNDAGTIAAVFLPLIISLTWRHRGVWRLIGIVGALACLGTIGRSGSRGATLAVGASLLTLVLGFRGRRLAFGLMLGAAAMAAGWTLAPSTLKQRIIVTFFSDEETYDTKERGGRINLWKRGVVFFAERPLTGVGIGNYGTREGQSLAGKAGNWFTAHNSPLEVAVETGLAGLVPYLMLLGLWFETARRSYRRPAIPGSQSTHRPEIMASLAGFLVGGMFLSHGYGFYLISLHALFLNQRRVWKASTVSLTRTLRTGRTRLSSVVAASRVGHGQSLP